MFLKVGLCRRLGLLMMTDSQSRRVCGSDQMLGCDVRSTCALKHQARMALGILIYPSAGLAESDHSNAFVYSVYCSSRPTAPTAPDLRNLKVLHDALLLGHRTWFLYRLAWTNSTSLSGASRLPRRDFSQVVALECPPDPPKTR